MSHHDTTYNVGIKAQPPGYRFTTDAYPSLQVIYVTDGELILEIDGVDRRVEPGQLVVLRVGGAFNLCCREIGYRGVYVIDATDTALAGSAMALTGDETVHMLADMIRHEVASPGEASRQVLSGLGQALLWRAMRLRPDMSRTSHTDTACYWTACARQAITSTLTTGQGVREVLASLPISYRQLSRYFIEQTGIAPKEYQVTARIAEARCLLCETHLPVTTIALELGYPSSQHFATQFRQVTGMTPQAYRKK